MPSRIIKHTLPMADRTLMIARPIVAKISPIYMMISMSETVLSQVIRGNMMLHSYLRADTTHVEDIRCSL